MVTIKQTAGTVSVQFPQNLVDSSYVERFLSYLRFAELASKNKMRNEDSFAVSETIKSDWWKTNKKKILKQIKG